MRMAKRLVGDQSYVATSAYMTPEEFRDMFPTALLPNAPITMEVSPRPLPSTPY